ncbi:Hypothetical predicted protein [Paramuricea clavata]|uniref:Uncharacterized protein n=1 Tax=Paramuricea clavata TaxID=317549 RepID=A0A6S7HKF6_PARCT|nr:Hypothetical predicted protein [Paramuricea clavata]
MDGFDKLERTSLSPKGKFFNSLTNEDISDTDYRRAQNVWNTFGMKTMRDYHDLYLKTDVLLLTDVMENFGKKVFVSRKSVIYIPDSEVKYILRKFTLNGGPYRVELMRV